ncbi:hypothetical protein UPYG_G00096460 [Umbra pygmaea]|uniref:Uncharacterized protein n=1 Tax=Umbra pygmaea TaxID=75934 RepID=A0ABD0XFV1_UMBPY
MKMSNPITSNKVFDHDDVQPNEKDGGGAGVSSPPKSLGQPVSVQRGYPKVLGTIQILIGFLVLLIGATMSASPVLDSIAVQSGIFVWGAVTYVIAGSLTVAADNHLNEWLVDVSRGMNRCAAIVSFAGTVLYSLDTAGFRLSFCNNSGSFQDCQKYWIRSQGIAGVMVVFSFLEFIVAICASSIPRKAVCHVF